MSTASNAQIEANRLNAQRSTGPCTDEGKAASSRNAIKHGLCSRVLVMPDESTDDFDELTQELMRGYGVRNLAERLIVEQIVLAHWRLRRLRRIERALYDTWAGQELNREKYDRHDRKLTLADLDWPRQHRNSLQENEIATLERHEDRLNSIISRAHRELERVRKTARIEAPPEEPVEEPMTEPAASGPQNEANSDATPASAEVYEGYQEPRSKGPGEDGVAEAPTPAVQGVPLAVPSPDLRL